MPADDPMPVVYDAPRRLADWRRLEAIRPEAGAVVRLRFYAGLTVDQAAETLGMSPATVKRKWTYARAWLFTARSDETAAGSTTGDTHNGSRGAAGTAKAAVCAGKTTA